MAPLRHFTVECVNLLHESVCCDASARCQEPFGWWDNWKAGLADVVCSKPQFSQRVAIDQLFRKSNQNALCSHSLNHVFVVLTDE